MTKNRLEAFSDGVIAIIITIMVLELRPPESAALDALKPLLPSFFSYSLSFVYLALWWNNHHHLLHAARRINGSVMWANTYLLFWLSLLPFATAWMGQTRAAAWPTVCYGVIFLMAAIAWNILENCLLALEGKDSTLAKAIGLRRKEKMSTAACVLAIGLAFIDTRWSLGIYLFIACLWVVPDSRIEKLIK